MGKSKDKLVTAVTHAESPRMMREAARQRAWQIAADRREVR